MNPHEKKTENKHNYDKLKVSKYSCMLVMTFSFFLVELIVGQMTKSITLITDSFHMLSDSLASIVGLFSVIIAARKTNKNTFGWVRAEILGELINSVFLVSVCLGMFVEAIERFFEPKQIEDPKLMLIVGSIGLGINLIGLFILDHSHSHSSSSKCEHDYKNGDEYDQFLKDQDKEEENAIKLTICAHGHSNDNTRTTCKDNNRTTCKDNNRATSDGLMKAVFLHVLIDFLGSVIVIISSLLHMYQNEINIHRSLIDFIEPALCTIVAFLIFFNAIHLLKDLALILLEALPDNINIQQLKGDINVQIPNSEIHELHVWRLTKEKIMATLNLRCMSTLNSNDVVAKLKIVFAKHNIHSSTIQLEFVNPN